MEVRLKPPVLVDDAKRYLMSGAELAWDGPPDPELATILEGIAKSMAVVSALAVPDDIEPLFGEDIAAAGRPPR